MGRTTTPGRPVASIPVEAQCGATGDPGKRGGAGERFRAKIMPPPLLIDLDQADLTKVEYTREYIYARMPHKFEFELVHGVHLLDRSGGMAVGFHDCQPDDWWARGHVPGMPIFPGVLQLEASAQLVAFMTRYVDGFGRFIAFGGVENCRFRELVRPPARYLLVAKIVENRVRRITADTQGIVDGRLVCEARIIGMAVPEREDQT